MENVPKHLGIIIDGNRRWAKEKGLPTLHGHKKGFEKVKDLVEWAKEGGIKTLTVFCFSTENWNRPKKEVSYLMSLAQEAIRDYFKKLGNYGVRINVIGQIERLPKTLQSEIKKTQEATKKNKDFLLNLALSYGGRAELVSAFKNIISKKIPLEKITEKIISDNLWTSDLDLIIRTGKEHRISNFLIWQAAYSELYFCPKYWPDFNEKDFKTIMDEYANRKRRFGK